ncbi:hypothetical protein OYC64_008334 [Pagothenia borchgrevinki]|uniref:Uncharacterized protein n=1 Tax=Pagothenia borchgrevinki TaxID=8213 RepID=A0ABD2G535_PAGBO
MVFSMHWVLNTASLQPTKCTPYFAQFGRHPCVPGVINATQDNRDDTSVLVPVDEAEQHLEAKAATIADLHSKIYQNIQAAQQRQKISYEKRKGKNVKSFVINVGDEVLRANKRKEGRKGGKLECNWFGPYVVSSITNKGVATLLGSTETGCKCVSAEALYPAYVERYFDYQYKDTF